MNYKELRKKKGMTQIDVSKAVGVSANAYRAWEYGASNPSKENYDKLLKIFEVKS